MVMWFLLKGFFSPVRNREIALTLAFTLLGLYAGEQIGLEKIHDFIIVSFILGSLLAETSADATKLRKEHDKLKEERDRFKIERDTLEKVVEKYQKRGH